MGERLALKLSERHNGTKQIQVEWLEFLTVNIFLLLSYVVLYKGLVEMKKAISLIGIRISVKRIVHSYQHRQRLTSYIL